MLEGLSISVSFTVTELDSVWAWNHIPASHGTVLFNHELSGAQLLYIQNDDRELGFNPDLPDAAAG